jgi:hypothetical protein
MATRIDANVGVGVTLVPRTPDVMNAGQYRLYASEMLGTYPEINNFTDPETFKFLIDDPTKSPVQCLRESRIMMAGHKWELFMLDLSFIGWYLLGLIPYVGYAAQVWSVPYIGMTKAVYYETLTGSNVWSFSGDYSV